MAGYFATMLQRIGLVKEDGSPKFTFHALRHWFCSEAVQYLDPHHAAKMSGHKNTAILLGTYGHIIERPEQKQRFEEMPSWLTPRVPQIEAQAWPTPVLPAPEKIPELAIPPECPIPVPDYAERWVAPWLCELWRRGNATEALQVVGRGRNEMAYELRRLRLPTVRELETMAQARIGQSIDQDDPAVIEVAPQIECPIDVPDMAPPWVRVYLRLIDQGWSQEAACAKICKGRPEVGAELRRLKMPNHRELKRRMRLKKIMARVDQGYQDKEIARELGYKTTGQIERARVEMHKRRPNKALKTRDKLAAAANIDSRPQHKNQLKLL